MKYLVVGAGGQLGTALSSRLSGPSLTAYSRAQLDIADREAVLKAVDALRPDAIINAAAYNFVDKAETDPAAAYAANEAGPRHLAEAAARTGAVVAHVSTDYVFDGTLDRPYVEDDATHPLSVYAKSKLAGEVAVRDAAENHIIVRTAWVYHDTGRNFFRLMLALSEKGPVKVVSDQFSSPTYAPHLAEGIVKLIEAGARGTFHLAGSGGGASRYEQLKTFYDRIGFRAQMTPVSMSEFPQPAPRPQRTVLATARTPRVVLPDWRDGVAAFAAAFEREAKV